MDTTHIPEHRGGMPGDERTTRRWKMAIAMVVVIALFYLLREHWNHLAGMASYLILLACPLMHLFGHGHGGHSSSGTSDRTTGSRTDF